MQRSTEWPRRLVAPPRLRTDLGEERHASSLELFFDLVFVVAVASLAELLKEDPSVGGFVRYGALFVPVWWAWVGYAFYSDRFETDDLVYRLLIFGAMLVARRRNPSTAGPRPHPASLRCSSVGYTAGMRPPRASRGGRGSRPGIQRTSATDHE